MQEILFFIAVASLPLVWSLLLLGKLFGKERVVSACESVWWVLQEFAVDFSRRIVAAVSAFIDPHTASPSGIEELVDELGDHIEHRAHMRITTIDNKWHALATRVEKLEAQARYALGSVELDNDE